MTEVFLYLVCVQLLVNSGNMTFESKQLTLTCLLLFFHESQAVIAFFLNGENVCHIIPWQRKGADGYFC